MFSLLDATSLKKVERKSGSHGLELVIPAGITSQQTPKNGFQQKRIKSQSFVGGKFRSKDGCLCCRKRKKRCDEAHPVCGACKSRGDNCVWPEHDKIHAIARKAARSTQQQKGRRDSTSSGGSIDGNAVKQESALQSTPKPVFVYSTDPPPNNLVLDSEKNTSRVTFSNLTTPIYEKFATPTSESPPCGADSRIELPPISPYVADSSGSHTLTQGGPLAYHRHSHSEGTLGFRPSISNGFGSSHQILPIAVDSQPTAPLSSGPSRSVSSLKLSKPAVTESALDDLFRIRSSIPTYAGHHPHPFLGEKGIRFLDFFKYKVTRVVAVSGDESNYFIQTFLKLSLANEAIANLLAAWGGVFLRGSIDQPEVEQFRQKSYEILQSTYLNRMQYLNKHEYYIVLCYYSISTGMYICAGDSKLWWENLLTTKDLIDNYGGFYKLCQDLNWTNDVVFLCSYFQYHDLTLSDALFKGTLYPIATYREVFDHVDFKAYGVDPLQGINQNVYELLGEIMNCKVKINAFKEDVDHLLNKAESFGFCEEFHNLQYKAGREGLIKMKDGLFDTLMAKVNSLHTIHGYLVENDPKEKLLHFMLFELYRNVCKIYCYIYIKESPPLANCVQELLWETLNMIDGLVDSKMIVVMCLPLIACGIAAYTAYDKFKIKATFEKLIYSCQVNNVEKAWETIQVVWNLNPEGVKYIDWSAICKDRDWHLSVC